jgi:hypothetical protein
MRKINKEWEKTLIHKEVSIGQPTYEKVNEELLLDNPLHVILNDSKVAYTI